MTSLNRNSCLLALAALLYSLQLTAGNHLLAQDIPEAILLIDEGEEYTYFKGTEPPPAAGRGGGRVGGGGV